jgi:hypothetical protein
MFFFGWLRANSNTDPHSSNYHPYSSSLDQYAAYGYANTHSNNSDGRTNSHRDSLADIHTDSNCY